MLHQNALANFDREIRKFPTCTLFPRRVPDAAAQKVPQNNFADTHIAMDIRAGIDDCVPADRDIISTYVVAGQQSDPWAISFIKFCPDILSASARSGGY